MMDPLRKLVPTAIKERIKQLLPGRFDDLSGYVGTDAVSGELQFELLKRQGCTPRSTVLEIGCGCLHVGIPLLGFLDAGNFVGVDPNDWLRERAMKDASVRQLVNDKRATFLSVDDFDASGLGRKFDFVFAHSVLSHAAHWQLDLFLKNAAKVLAPGGRVLASLRLAEGNAYGSAGTPDKKDSLHQEWQYPGVTWFTLPTVIQMADAHGLTALHIPEYTEFYARTRPKEHHDWIVFAWKAAR
ncbi:MAG TPA: class I SAM-dependent methyltransferase [Stellaceae bacterium]|nr:class I SAM-dependent methyltransferase [Stellaceae bacterium]